MLFAETKRLVLRRFRAADAPAFAVYRSDPDVARYQPWTPPLPLSQAAELVSEFATGDPKVAGWFQYAIALRETPDDLIGDVGVWLHENMMQAEIGFSLDPRYQGCGYGSEAVRAILDYLFAELKLVRISAECDARNAASARLLQRVGFQQEGLRRRHTWFKGEWTDDLIFGLLFQDFMVPGQGAA